MGFPTEILGRVWNVERMVRHRPNAAMRTARIALVLLPKKLKRAGNQSGCGEYGELAPLSEVRLLRA
jgi:hypothetical protein